MKTTFTTFFLLISLTIFAQKAMTFEDAEKNGIRISQLDSIYPSGLHADSTKAVFWDKQDEFIKAYQKTLQDLGAYLKANNFSWDKQTRCFNRIYFSKDGTIDYFLFNFSKDAITPEREKQFAVLLNKFVKDYRFPLSATTGFAQCSPVRYSD